MVTSPNLPRVIPKIYYYAINHVDPNKVMFLHPPRRKPHMYWPADDKKFLLLHYQSRWSQYNKFNIHCECKAVFQYIVRIYHIAYSIKLQVGKLMLEHSNWYLAPMICSLPIDFLWNWLHLIENRTNLSTASTTHAHNQKIVVKQKMKRK